MGDVSVVIPARNAAATLPAALKSVLIAPEVGEVIVINDGSTDGTADVARAIGDPRVRVIPGPQAGVAAALNAGFDAVTKPLVARCDADDACPPDRFRWQVGWLLDHPDFIAVSGGFASRFPDGTHAADLACEGEARDVTSLLLRGESVTHLCTWLTRTEAVRRAGGARIWFRTGEDIDLQYRLSEVGKIWHVPYVTYFYNLNDQSITHTENSETLKFYHSMARQFALERLATREDALSRGEPPLPPLDVKNDRRRVRGRDQALGHAIGAAWAECSAGIYGPAIRRLLTIAAKNPNDLSLYIELIKIHIKVLSQKTGTFG